MAGRIPQSFIDDLLDRVDIVELINQRVPLKKAGKNYSACCPFHDEKTPSFSVSPDKQFYYCFGCGASGSALGFLLEFDHLSFPEAVEYLAGTQGLEVPREASSFNAKPERKDIYALLEQAAKYYQEQLRSHPQSEKARQYLQGRGIAGQPAHRFGLGFAPPGWDNLLSFLGKQEDDKKRLLEAGLLTLNEEKQRQYDRFRDRIMFPIRDVRGRVIAFGGRVLGDEKPKYLNSPETEVFHKGRELYGLYEANQANRRLEQLLIVEGYMDVVVLAQYGIDFAAATLGTAASTAHLEKAFRYTSNVIFCFDGDEAGRKAAERALHSALPVLQEGRQVQFMFLPEGEDPDSLVQKEQQDGFMALLEEAMPLSEYLFELGSAGLDLGSAEGRATLVQRLTPMFQQIPDNAFKEQLLNLLAAQSQTAFGRLQALLQYSANAQHGGSRGGPLAGEPRQSPASAPVFTPDSGAAPVWDAASEGSYPDEYPEYSETDWDSPPQGAGNAIEAPQGAGIGASRPASDGVRDRAPGFRRLNLFDEACSLLLQYPHLLALAEGLSPQALKAAHMPAQAHCLADVIQILADNPGASLNKMLGLWQSQYGAEHSERLYELSAREWLLSTEALERQLRDILAKIRQQMDEEPLEQLMLKLRQGIITAEEKASLNTLLLRQKTPSTPHS